MAEEIKKQVDAVISCHDLEDYDEKIVIRLQHGHDDLLFKFGMTREDAATFASAIGLMLARTEPGSITVDFISMV